MSVTFKSVFFLFLIVFFSCQNQSEGRPSKSYGDLAKKVLIDTSKGEIEVELYGDKAPVTVKNFTEYVKNGHYNGTVFHRVINNFMIQGGGFTADLKEKPTKEPITNEAHNGLTNEAGTLAMARTSDVNSATSQFFINVRNNPHLNHQSKTPRGYGYAVFGKVVKGMSVVNQIKMSQTGTQGPFRDVPTQPIVINKIKILK